MITFYTKTEALQKTQYCLNLLFIFLLCGVAYPGPSGQAPASPFAKPLGQCWEAEQKNWRWIASDNAKGELLQQAREKNLSSLLFAVEANGNVYALNPVNGEEIWKTSSGGEIDAAPIINENNILVLNKVIKAYTDFSESADRTVPKDPDRYFLTSISGTTGIPNWRRDIGFLRNPVFRVTAAGGIEISEKHGERKTFDIDSGRPIDSPALMTGFSTGLYSEHPLIKAAVVTAGISGGETDFLGTLRGELTSLDAQKRKINWKKKLGAKITAIENSNAGLIVTSLDNFIYLIAKETGKIKWKKRLSGRVSVAPLILENEDTVAAVSLSSLYLIRLSTGKPVHTLDFSPDRSIIDKPIYTGGRLILLTETGLAAFSPNCI